MKRRFTAETQSTQRSEYFVSKTFCSASGALSDVEGRLLVRYPKMLLTTETQSAQSPNQSRSISRKGAKGAKKIRFPDLAFLASWREQFSNSAPSAPPCEISEDVTHHRDAEYTEVGVFFIKNSFTPRPPRLLVGCPKILLTTETQPEGSQAKDQNISRKGAKAAKFGHAWRLGASNSPTLSPPPPRRLRGAISKPALQKSLKTQ
jgi:hypothetical protein